ncbi:CG43781, isoform A [Anopheles sinensis]|uniref:CG43781, isoform A n=1 Tax=Anopheles sinensis TaxID=74873 RepID=A0A084W4A3_ANOSI|nr:CG43781, isoform A [Anopheles sinensis]
MAWLVAYPAVAMLAMFIVLVIMLILRYGAQLCRLRHHALPDDQDLRDQAYDQKVSYA